MLVDWVLHRDLKLCFELRKKVVNELTGLEREDKIVSISEEPNYISIPGS